MVGMDVCAEGGGDMTEDAVADCDEFEWEIESDCAFDLDLRRFLFSVGVLSIGEEGILSAPGESGDGEKGWWAKYWWLYGAGPVPVFPAAPGTNEYPFEPVPRLELERVSDVVIVPLPPDDLLLLFRGRDVYDSAPKSAPSASASAAWRAASAASGSKFWTGCPCANGPNSCEDVTDIEPEPVPDVRLGANGEGGACPKTGPLPYSKWIRIRATSDKSE